MAPYKALPARRPGSPICGREDLPPQLRITKFKPMKIYKEFTFEAAHFLPSAPEGHQNSRIHGHSFRTRVWVAGNPDPETGLLIHFDDLAEAVAEAREALDHRFLNEIDGLSVPTLENITVWLWQRLANRVPGLARIEVSRDSCHEGCVYDGPASEHRAAAE